MSIDSTWHDAAVQTALVVHIEQIVSGAAKECDVDGCNAEAVMLVTSEPDMDPGFVCAAHGFQWIDTAVHVLRALFPPPA